MSSVVRFRVVLISKQKPATFFCLLRLIIWYTILTLQCQTSALVQMDKCGVGTVILNALVDGERRCLKLENVMYFPGANCSLLSVSKLKCSGKVTLIDLYTNFFSSLIANFRWHDQINYYTCSWVAFKRVNEAHSISVRTKV
ncbi:hypothetical protein MP228_008317 [Amoeboaphelidium protococcarum]|nr:hypothetical protein MP228_008317 [Amoeboaphelidium protococcarum]